MTLRPLLLAALLAPSLAAALPWDGTYRLSEDADCDRVGEEGGALRIAEGVLHGVELTCQMTEPVDVLNLDATLYTLDCEGEGQSWTERAMLMKAAEGDAIYVAWRGYVFRYDRCPSPDGTGAEEAAASEAADHAEDEDTADQAAEDGEDAPDEAEGSPEDQPAGE